MCTNERMGVGSQDVGNIIISGCHYLNVLDWIRTTAVIVRYKSAYKSWGESWIISVGGV